MCDLMQLLLNKKSKCKSCIVFAQKKRLGCNILSKYCQILPSTFCMYLIVTNKERLRDNLLEPKEKPEI